MRLCGLGCSRVAQKLQTSAPRLEFQDVNYTLTSGSCARKGSDVKFRFNCMRGLLIAATIVAFFSFVLSAFMAFRPAYTLVRILSVILPVLSAFAAAACGGLFVFTIEKWLYCDKKYCDLFGATDCTNKYAFSLYIDGAEIILCIVGTALAAVSLCLNPRDAESQETGGNEPASQDMQEATTDPEAAPADSSQQVRSKEPPTQEDRPPDLPEGDWTFVADCGMYWSEENYLYLHLESGQFYDPNSGMWYNSETGEWFYADEEGANKDEGAQ